MTQNKKRKIYIFDTTLRDGEQSPGASLTPDEKLTIARQLERLRVDVIEAGFPAASPGEMKAVAMIAEAIRIPEICGLSRMMPQDIDACRRALEKARRRRLHVFLATSQIHLQYKLKKDKRQVLKMVSENIARAKRDFNRIEFSPEDASRTEPHFLAQVIKAAVEAGATSVNVPDTVGYAIPDEFGELMHFLIKKCPQLGKEVILSVHCHNDLGLAVANSLAAVRAGANQVECTVNGIGERAGNASLEEIVMAIDTRKDFMDCRTDIRMGEITKASRLVSQLTGMVVQPNKAIVGRNAFSHASGIHQDGILKKRQTYEIIDPKKIGLAGTQLLLGKLSGRHAFIERVVKLGFNLAEKEMDAAFRRFKELADKKKYIFDEDVETLVQEGIGQTPEAWKLEHLSVHTETGKKPKATMTLVYAGKKHQGSSTGDGPIDACYLAIEKMMNTGARVTHYGIQSLTGGKDAQGEVVVKLELAGREVTGRGTDTDIIVASVRAYLHAVNKICAHSAVFESGPSPV